MVRRLVEHEEVRAGGDRHREREPPPLAAREHRHRLLVLVPAGEEEAAEQRLRVGAREPGHRLDALEHGAARVELDLLLREVAGLDAVPEADRPAAASRRPSSVSSSVVLPEPFGPTSATCSPRSIANDAPASSVAVAERDVEPLGLDDGPPAARRLEELESERARAPRQERDLVRAAARSCSSRPICVSFACACFALSFFARNRSTKRSSRAMSASTRSTSFCACSIARRLLAPPGVPRPGEERRRGRRRPRASRSSPPRGTSGRARRGSRRRRAICSSRSSHSRLATSRWFVGSSRSSRSGSPPSARASEARVSSPPEKVRSGRSRSLVGEAEPAHDRGRAVAPAVAAGVLEARLRLGVAVERRLVVRAAGHRLLERAQLVLDARRGRARPRGRTRGA